MSASAENIEFNLEHAKAKKRKYRLYGSGIPFALGFILIFMSSPPNLSTGIVAGIFMGLMFGVAGLVISEIARLFCKDQRTLAKVNGSGGSTAMRPGDRSALIGVSIVIGLVCTVAAWAIWQDWFDSHSNSFWLVWAIMAVVALPFAYALVKEGTTCSNCKKPFSLTDTRQETIERFVKYKNENVYENGVSYRRDVPYNCRRYWQFTKCDNCGHAFKTEKEEELRA